MAKGSAKKTVQENEKTVVFLKKGFILANALHIFFRFIVFYSSLKFSHVVLYSVTGSIGLILFYQLKSMAKPEYNSKGDILHGGYNLNDDGLVQYMFDVIYVTWFVHVTTILHDNFWYFYLLIPTYAIYAIVTKLGPYLRSASLTEVPHKISKRK
ncbi:DUF788-domain-containing protein [Rozella allomycis CSF55]|uniref:DUF788-domain-containing protein n=1 Tax=Rozella allomycis (strain CSF55) TaxID=988480 RepID=A0A4P9YLI0_ROZAC|nr:DUF788-domain-containing protein [Rozella allomycis CSF55]